MQNHHHQCLHCTATLHTENAACGHRPRAWLPGYRSPARTLAPHQRLDCYGCAVSSQAQTDRCLIKEGWLRSAFPLGVGGPLLAPSGKLGSEVCQGGGGGWGGKEPREPKRRESVKTLWGPSASQAAREQPAPGVRLCSGRRFPAQGAQLRRAQRRPGPCGREFGGRSCPASGRRVHLHQHQPGGEVTGMRGGFAAPRAPAPQRLIVRGAAARRRRPSTQARLAAFRSCLKGASHLSTRPCGSLPGSSRFLRLFLSSQSFIS